MIKEEYLQNLLNSKKYSFEKRFAVSPVNVVYEDIMNNKSVKEFLELLDKYKISYSIENRQSTTYTRPFNLNRNWIVTDLIECIEVTEGCYPLNWNVDDLLNLERLADNSNLIFMIYHYGNRKLINR